MTKDELIQFLQENLTIEIDRDYGFYAHDSYVVKLKLEDVVISTSSTSIYEGKS